MKFKVTHVSSTAFNVVKQRSNEWTYNKWGFCLLNRRRIKLMFPRANGFMHLGELLFLFVLGTFRSEMSK